MRSLTDNVNEANEILKINYVVAEICRYSPSHGRLVIRLRSDYKMPYNPDISKIVFITMVGCQYISGNFRIENPKLSISQNSTNEEYNEIVTILEDKDSRFKLVANAGFAVTWGVDSDFEDMFENFVSQW